MTLTALSTRYSGRGRVDRITAALAEAERLTDAGILAPMKNFMSAALKRPAGSTAAGDHVGQRVLTSVAVLAGCTLGGRHHRLSRPGST